MAYSEKIMKFLCIMALLIASYLLYLHYTPAQLNASFCNLNSYLSCATVNTSSYATLFGVPVAFIGILGYLLLTYLLYSRAPHARVFFTFAIVIAFVFMLYLTIAEFFFIKAVCILCILIALITFTLLSMSILLYGKQTKTFIKEIHFE